MVGDKAAGVGLVLSPETARKLTAWGTCEGGRVIWARLHGVFHDLLVVNAYIPHRGRKAPPFMEDTMDQVADLVREKRKASDCVVIMGDVNGRLQRGEQGSKRVGPFTPHARGDEGGDPRGRWRLEGANVFTSQTCICGDNLLKQCK